MALHKIREAASHKVIIAAIRTHRPDLELQQRKCRADIRFIGGLLILYGYMFASGYAAQLQWLARLFTA